VAAADGPYGSAGVPRFTLKLRAPFAAGVLVLSVSAASCFAQAVPVGTSALGGAAPPSFVTETIAWGGARALPLEIAPLAALASPVLRLSTEWAPLYRGKDGARFEQARQQARFATSWRAWRAAAELSSEASTFRGGQTEWGFDAGAAAAHRGALALGVLGTRASVAASATLSPEGRAGFALEARTTLAPGWTASLGAADVPREGRLDVRWEDEAITSSGRWDERRARASIGAGRRTGRLAVTLEAFDRVPVLGRATDGFEPRLAWRDASISGSHVVGRALLSTELRHGEGRQRLVVSRHGTAYAVAAGPLREDVAIAGAGPRNGRWQARAWMGRNRDEASGSLALWPFDGLAAVAGTRYAARTDIDLRHAGVALDGRHAEHRGWDGGLALWVVDPHGRYETWRGTLFALGRDDDSGDEWGAARTWLAGVRVARTQDIASLRLRAEWVQWAPAYIERDHGAATAGSSGSSGGPAPTTGGDHARTWGGTVVRVALEVPASLAR